MDLCDGFFTQKVAGVTIYTIKPKIRTRNLFIRNVDKGKIDAVKSISLIGDSEVKENLTKFLRILKGILKGLRQSS